MANPIVKIIDADNPGPELKKFLAGKAHVYFVILGDNSGAAQLTTAAGPFAKDFRYLMRAPKSQAVLQAFADQPRAADIGNLPSLSNWCTLAIAFDGTVVTVNDGYSLGDVPFGFLLAESYKKTL